MHPGPYKPEKLAVFLPGLYAGGAERTMLKLAGGLAARGHEVDLVLARAVGPHLPEVPAAVRLVDLHAPRVLFSLPALVRYIQRERPAILLSALTTNIIAIWARRLVRWPIRVVVSERNTLTSETRHYASDLRLRMMPKLIHRFYPWADSIVAVSNGVAEDLSRAAGIPRDHIHVIYNPVITPELDRQIHAPLDHPWFKPDAPPVILAAGRLTAQKDYPTLIEAFARVHQKRPARLMILGEGEERVALEDMVKRHHLEGKISLPGFIANPYPFMAKAAVFVLSSKWEGLPGVLIEALYCGAPLIATDCPSGPGEILAGGKYGRLVPVGDPNGLASAILSVLEDRPPRPPQESWQRFELEHVLDQYSAVLFNHS